MNSTASAPTTTKQIICIKWGAKYGPEYVNVMYGMVARNITGAFKFHCFTDDAAGIRAEVNCLPLPDLGCEIPPGTLGKWKKSALWGRELPGGISGTVLFIDLDSVILGNIDDYFTYGNPDDVILARNWLKPMRRLGQTSIFRFTVGTHPYMLDNLRADPAGISKKYQFEQHYVTHGIRTGIKFWPEAWTKHFRAHCLPRWPLNMFIEPKLPKGAKVVTFPGGPNPSDVVVGRWKPDEIHRPPGEHIRYAWSLRKNPEARWFRKLKGYVIAPQWLVDNWKA